MDAELRELRRRVAASPDDAGESLALAFGLARADMRAEAARELYRATALGADRRVCREALEGLGARASPWTHVSGDAARTFSSPARGPRRGAVVARSAPFPDYVRVVIDGASGIVALVGGSLVRLDARDLTETARFPSEKLVDVAVNASGVVAVETTGNAERLLLLDAALVPTASAELPPSWRFQRLLVDERGEIAVFTALGRTAERALITYDRTLGNAHQREGSLMPYQEPALARGRFAHLAGHPRASPRELVVSDVDGTRRLGAALGDIVLGPVIRADDSVVALCAPSGAPLELALVSAAGEARAVRLPASCRLPVYAHGLAAAEDGSLLLCTTTICARLEATGEVRWSQPDPPASPGHVLDAEGTCFVSEKDENRNVGIAARAPGGSLLFRTDAAIDPLAIDGLGHLIALAPDNSLVAIE